MIQKTATISIDFDLDSDKTIEQDACNGIKVLKDIFKGLYLARNDDIEHTDQWGEHINE